MLLPVIGPLPQISHRCAISEFLLEVPAWGLNFITQVTVFCKYVCRFRAGIFVIRVVNSATQTRIEGGISLLKGEAWRPIFRLLYAELLTELLTWRGTKNSRRGAADSCRQFRATVGRVCRASLEAFLVVISVLDLRGGLW
jgi:hypothetical protein